MRWCESVPEAEASQDPEPWFIFNDFLVQNLTEDEVLSFPSDWKVPAVLYFERVDLRQRLDFSRLPDKMDPTILCHDTNIAVYVPSSKVFVGCDTDRATSGIATLARSSTCHCGTRNCLDRAR